MSLYPHRGVKCPAFQFLYRQSFSFHYAEIFSHLTIYPDLENASSWYKGIFESQRKFVNNIWTLDEWSVLLDITNAAHTIQRSQSIEKGKLFKISPKCEKFVCFFLSFKPPFPGSTSMICPNFNAWKNGYIMRSLYLNKYTKSNRWPSSIEEKEIETSKQN